MDVRTYRPDDFAGCLAVFDSNRPTAFGPHERREFEAFLANVPGKYFVMEHDGSIVGCGGYVFENPGLASLTWLIVKREFHGNGLGRFLVFSALREITKDGDPAMVRLCTVPATAGFFEKQGFRRVRNAGELVEMAKKLKVCS